jgi:hypothetical protein
VKTVAFQFVLLLLGLLHLFERGPQSRVIASVYFAAVMVIAAIA